jgi:hypothetical protein
MTPSSSPSPDLGHMVRQAIEGQIGMLTCQVIELQVQLQQAYQQIGQLQASAVAEAADTPSSPTLTPPTTTSPATTPSTEELTGRD